MDAFPVEVTIDGRTHRSCRLHHDGETVTVWEWDYAARSPVVLLRAGAGADMALPDQLGGLPWTLSDGVVIADQKGCGCSHPLRHRSAVDLDAPAREHTTP